MKGKKAVKAAKSAAQGPNAQAMKAGAKQAVKDMSTGAKAAVVPGVVAGAVAGKVAASKDKKKMEKKAASMATKRLLVKARKGGKAAVAKGKAKATGAIDKLDKASGGDPVRVHGLATGAAVGGGSAYIGQKKIQQDKAKAKSAK